MSNKDYTNLPVLTLLNVSGCKNHSTRCKPQGQLGSLQRTHYMDNHYVLLSTFLEARVQVNKKVYGDTRDTKFTSTATLKSWLLIGLYL